MKKTTRVLYLIIGSTMPIFIGGLHLFTHFNELISNHVQQLLQQSIMINGQEQTLWNTWGIMSVMMGVSFIIIGLLNISIFCKLSKDEFPPVFAIIAMVLYQFGVTYVGYEFEQAFQFYGGIFGGMMISVCLILTLRRK